MKRILIVAGLLAATPVAADDSSFPRPWTKEADEARKAFCATLYPTPPSLRLEGLSPEAQELLDRESVAACLFGYGHGYQHGYTAGRTEGYFAGFQQGRHPK